MMFERICKVDIPQNDEPRNSAGNESQPVIIAQWELNSRESLRVELHEYRGTQLIGIRKWFAGANGAMAPGKSGINLNLKHLPRLTAAINDALSKARACDLIPLDGGGRD
jgi:hypothetical protein